MTVEQWLAEAQSLQNAGSIERAMAAIRQSLTVHPGHPDALTYLGNLLQEQGKWTEAEDAYQQALVARPHSPLALYNLGNAMDRQHRTSDAIAAYERALSLNPSFAEAWSNLAAVLYDSGRIDESIAASRRAISIRPDFAEAHNCLGLALLLQGDYPQGFVECEWRWRIGAIGLQRPKFNRPQWDGRGLNGRRILIYAEQGLGDAINYARFVHPIIEQGAQVILQCPRVLNRLMRTLRGVTEVVSKGDRLASFDVHFPLLSLPLMLGTTRETIPNSVPYLSAPDPDGVERWRLRLAESAHGRLKVGLAWAGARTYLNDHYRSLGHAALAPLAEIQDVQFISLQKNDAQQARNLPAGVTMTDWMNEMEDFADTAALIANLDLVISVDTAVAHLAGAMGKPTWLLLPFAPDWRWMLGRCDSPWYPTMKLFRQQAAGDWGPVVEQVARMLSETVSHAALQLHS